ncbi:unnamed protein product [Caretta caretta]
MLICVICRESRAHRTHRVVPTEEAAQAYKEQIQTQLNTLKQERGELLEWKQDAETQSQEYLGKIEAERQKIMSEFEQLRQFLDEQERLLLAQLEELDKEIVKIQDENVTKLSEKISRLGDLISEIEEKCQQPTSEFLQDIKSTWSRCEKVKFEKPMAVSQDVSERIGVSSQRNVCLQEALKKFKETLPYQLNFLISKAEKEAWRRCVLHWQLLQEVLEVCAEQQKHLERETVQFDQYEPASWNRLLVRGVVAVVGVLVLLYRCGFWKGRGKVFAYSQLVFRKLLTHPSPQPGSRQDSQEPELPAVCDRDGDQAQGTRNRNQDPALENGEGDLLMEDRRFPQEPRGRGPLGGDTGVAQETGAALPILQGDRESAGIKD